MKEKADDQGEGALATPLPLLSRGEGPRKKLVLALPDVFSPCGKLTTGLIY